MEDTIRQPVGVWKCGKNWYAERRAGHPELWVFVQEFIAKHKIQRMLEIGGGDGWAGALVDRYCCVDVNQDALDAGRATRPQDLFIHDDWMTMPTGSFVGGFDLVLAAAVVEHLSPLDGCLRRMVAVGSRFIIVSFFRGLARDADVIKQVESKDTEWSESGGVYYDNAYALQSVCGILDLLGVKGQFIMRGEDTILVIKNE